MQTERVAANAVATLFIISAKLSGHYGIYLGKFLG